MWTIPQWAAFFKQRTPAMFEFLDECSEAFGWLIVAVSIGVVVLSLLYSVAPPPLHVPGAVLT